MRLTALLIGLALVVGAPAQAKGHKPAGPAREPVVVELYTAQGCADCPKANDLLIKLSEEPGVIALTLPVDYWDYLGWKDTFAKPEFTERQRGYMSAMKLRDVYTPQIVIGGAQQVSALKTEEVEAEVKKAQAAHLTHPSIGAVQRGRVQLGSGRVPRGGAVVWLVRYDPALHEVEVKKGENKGQTIRHGNVVRELVKLGDWKGQPRTVRLPKSANGKWKSLVLIQARTGGRILAARRL